MGFMFGVSGLRAVAKIALEIGHEKTTSTPIFNTKTSLAPSRPLSLSVYVHYYYSDHDDYYYYDQCFIITITNIMFTIVGISLLILLSLIKNYYYYY